MSDYLNGEVVDERTDGVRGGVARWVVAAACVALGALGGLALDAVLPKTYAATTEVLVLPTAAGVDSRGGGTSVSEIQIETEAQLVTSAQVAQAAAKSLDGRVSAVELLADASVQVPSNSQVLQVSFSASEPQIARDASQALADAYLARRNSDAATQVTALITSLEASVAERQTQLKDNATALGKLSETDTAQRVLLEAQRQLLVDQIADFNARLVELRLRSASGGQIITAAPLPAGSSTPVPHLGLVAGLLVGLLAGTGVLMFWRGGSTSARHATGTAARVPALAGLSIDVSAPTVAPSDIDVLDRLCRQIADHPAESGPLVLLGVGDAALRHRAAFGIVESWATTLGSSVLVVTEPGGEVGPLAALEGRPGFRDLATDRAEVSEVLMPVPGLRSSVIGPGTLAQEDDGRLERPQLVQVWLELERNYDMTVVQAGSPLDQLAAHIALTAGRIVVLVDKESIDAGDYQAVVAELEWLGLTPRVVGMVTLGRREARAARAALREAPAGVRDVLPAPAPSPIPDRSAAASPLRTQAVPSDPMPRDPNLRLARLLGPRTGPIPLPPAPSPAASPAASPASAPGSTPDPAPGPVPDPAPGSAPGAARGPAGDTERDSAAAAPGEDGPPAVEGSLPALTGAGLVGLAPNGRGENAIRDSLAAVLEARVPPPGLPAGHHGTQDSRPPGGPDRDGAAALTSQALEDELGATHDGR